MVAKGGRRVDSPWIPARGDIVEISDKTIHKGERYEVSEVKYPGDSDFKGSSTTYLYFRQDDDRTPRGRSISEVTLVRRGAHQQSQAVVKRFLGKP